MRHRRLRYEPSKIEVTREEILADLLYPAAAPEGGDRPAVRRARVRRSRRQARR